MLVAHNWIDYELIDAGNGEKIERWGNTILQRPDPQAIWPRSEWPQPSAKYIRSSTGGGRWQNITPFPKEWIIKYDSTAGQLRFGVEPTGFKHTGIFPEQAVNWDFMGNLISVAAAEGREIRILNLFAYTGAATVACSVAGAKEVVHVDASKGMNDKAKRNSELSGSSKNHIRYITEDVNKFVDRERRRGRKYDGIIMDPPSYGRGPGGELWKLDDELYTIVNKCNDLLVNDPLFFIINSYTSGYAPSVLANMLELTVCEKIGGRVEAHELGLAASSRNIVLPCGSTGRWFRREDHL